MQINTVFQLYAEKMFRPEAFESAAKMLMIPELIAYQLTGVQVAEYSNCSTTGLLDARSRDWSDTIISKLGLPRHIFTEISHSR